jgi:hypothetical protein
MENKTENNDMKPMDEFRDVGKKLPYQAPNDFFEQFPEKTLQRAKQRERHRKKIVLLWRPVAVAASLVAVVLLSYLISGPGKPDDKLLVQEKQPQPQQVVEQKPEISKEPADAVIKTGVQEKPDLEAEDTEGVIDVLADLSDEELMQLAAMYQADPFIDEAMQ